MQKTGALVGLALFIRSSLWPVVAATRSCGTVAIGVVRLGGSPEGHGSGKGFGARLSLSTGGLEKLSSERWERQQRRRLEKTKLGAASDGTVMMNGGSEQGRRQWAGPRATSWRRAWRAAGCLMQRRAFSPLRVTCRLLRGRDPLMESAANASPLLRLIRLPFVRPPSTTWSPFDAVVRARSHAGA